MAEETSERETDDSRRTFMKKGALASSAVALGLAGSGSVAGEFQQQQQQAPSTGLVFVNDYHPNIGFQVVNRVQQSTVNEILGQPEDDPAVDDPTDWNGYLVDLQGCGPGNYHLVMLREGILQQDQTYSFTTDAVFFSNELQLLEARIQQGTGGDGGDGDGGDGDGGDGGGNGGANASNPL